MTQPDTSKAQQRELTMNCYKAFYKGKSVEVQAMTSFLAQKEAVKIFKARKDWDVSVILCEKDGEQVTQHTSDL